MIWELTDTNGRNHIVKGDFTEVTEHALAFYTFCLSTQKQNRDLVCLFPLAQIKKVVLTIGD